MTDNLPLIPAHTIGSHAWPAWLYSALDAMQRGEYGPKDWQETQEDAVDLALRDQEDAGIDIVTDGEMRRIGFFTAGFWLLHGGLLRASNGAARTGPAAQDGCDRA